VGGAVRDLLRTSDEAKAPSPTMDYDFTTNAQPAEILALFADSFYENNFGTVSVTAEHLLEQMGVAISRWSEFALPTLPGSTDRIIDLSRATKLHQSLKNNPSADTSTDTTTSNNHPKLGLPLFEITTFRSDGTYSDHRRPDEVTWGTSLTEDLDRRDFTINAMALSVSDELLTTFDFAAASPLTSLTKAEFTVHDPHQGLADIAAHRIATVGDPHRRFAEDALRMLRAIRLAVQLNYSIDDATFEAIVAHAPSLAKISQERISDELLKVLASDFPAEGIELLDEAQLLPHILPELLACKGVEQGGHHTTDVWVHSLDALRECPSTDPVVRLATLLHDIGKPATQAFTDKTITFYSHEIVGSRIASAITKRLRLSKKDRDRIFTLVRYHMFHYQPHDTDAAIRRFMRKVGLENVDDMLDLREADRLGSNARRTSWRLEEMKQRMVEQLNQPMDVTDLAINGHDLMESLGMKPGPQLGEVIQHLFELVLEKPELNTKEQLIGAAKTKLEQL
jgi:tRNA nucleotidyltransferase (CCA-adding enzyme)